MSRRRTLFSFSVVLLFACFYLVTLVPEANTYPLYINEAKRLGYPAQNCAYCHANPTGGQGWNDRGAWLQAEKERRGSNSVDVAWLKDYKPAPKGKRKK